MFTPILGVISPFGMIALLFLVAVLLAAPKILARFAKRSTGHSHDSADMSDFSPVHRGKAHVGGCKFDSTEEKRTRFLARPRIDLSNLPAPDPRMVKAMAGITDANVRAAILALSGEVATTINGQTVKIGSRSSHGQGVMLAMDFVEAFYKSLGIKVQRVAYKVRGKTYYNLEATLVGKTSPDKVLVLGSHLDSTAGNTYSNEPVAPGADDDASGTVALMEIARALKDLPLECTVRLVHFTGEEQGLWGSYAYSDQLAAAKVNVIAMLQMDMVGYANNNGNRLDIHDAANRNGSHALTEIAFREIARYGLNLKPVDTHNHAVEDRSDHAGFLDHGAPALCFSEEFTDEGFNPAYHSVKDRINIMNIPFMLEATRAILATAAAVAKVQP
jgi:Zn-dependent M28 family amino/carboxypeptidase